MKPVFEWQNNCRQMLKIRQDYALLWHRKLRCATPPQVNECRISTVLTIVRQRGFKVNLKPYFTTSVDVSIM